MCDYSLENVASRPAQAGEQLVTSGFPNTSSKGFAGPSDPNIAVCLLHGTELAFAEDVEVEIPASAGPLGVMAHMAMRVINNINASPPKTLGRMATFVQLNKNFANMYHDALQFSDGTEVSLTRLVSGQMATILSLPASQVAPPAMSKREVELV